MSVEQIVAVAPDAGALVGARKLANPVPWKGTGRSASAVWGECQGSAVYRVGVDLAEFAYQCSCPSRKRPCKHVLGLLLFAAAGPGAVALGEPPAWLGEWLAQRAERARRRGERKEKPAKPADPDAKAKRAGDRHQRVLEGLDRLDLWLTDLVRNGLAGLERQGASFWEEAARRLVDAQAPGLAGRVRRAGELPGSRADWPRRLLADLGRLALLCHAYRRLDGLDASLQADVRQLVGWTLTQEEVASRGETVVDRWLVVGQYVEDEDRLRVQRSWLIGQATRRAALALQFSASGQPFAEAIVAGTSLEGQVLFWPSAWPQRGRVVARGAGGGPVAEGLPGVGRVEDFLREVAGALSRQPWLERFLCVLRQATPARRENGWGLRDCEGRTLPLARGDPWKLLALSGGRPIDFAGEWDGEALRPLGAWAEGTYHILGGAG